MMMRVIVCLVFSLLCVHEVIGGVWNEPQHPAFKQYHRKVMVMGEVVDHENGKPIRQFSVILVELTDGTSIRWWPEYRFGFERQSGEFTCVKWLHTETEYVVIVTAAGYESFVSKPFRLHDLKDDELVVHADLYQTEVMSGRIVDWDGKPVRGADVLVPEQGRNDGRVGYDRTGVVVIGVDDVFTYLEGTNQGMSGVDGQFYVTRPEGGYVIAAFTPEGYAVVREEDFKDGDDIVLTKWSRFKGVAKLGEGDAGQETHISFKDEKRFREMLKNDRAGLPYVMFGDQTRIGEGGAYVSPVLPKGDYEVKMFVENVGRDYSTPMHITKESLGIGTCKVMDFGGKGCTIRGQLVGGEGQKIDEVGVRLKRKGVVFDLSLPAGFDEMSLNEKRGWMTVAVNGAPWQLYHESSEKKAKQRVVWQKTDKAGRFTFYDVPEGKWVLTVDQERPLDVVVKRGEEDGEVYEREVAFELKDQARDRRRLPEVLNDESLMLDTVYGDGLKVADYQGKVVLVHFWGMWCGACDREMKDIKRLVEKYDGRDDFEVVGVVRGDYERKLLMGYLAKKEIDWIQVWDQGDLPLALTCNEGVPLYAVIGKNGEWHQWKVEIADLEKEVQAALGEE